jgi:quercetin dioxygenase-like cupin family protein
MSTTAEEIRAQATSIEVSEPTIERRRSSALGLMGGGLAVIVLAAGLLATAPHHSTHPAARAAGAPAAAGAAPGAVTIQSPGDITVLNMTYEPGKSSGWHTHRGIHAVAVISGTLTVYDQNCAATTYRPGEAYIGGQQLHLVRNEGSDPATMVVTYVNPVNQGPAQVASTPTTPPCDVR